MRRGLMHWSRDEVPPALLERRLAALVAGVCERGLHAVLIYTDLTRPAAVSALTHFIPYWNQGVLEVEPAGGATLVATMSRRVNDWIEATSRLSRVVNTLDLAVGVADALPQPQGGAARVGVVDLAGLPAGVVASIRGRHPEVRLEEAGDLLDAALAAGGPVPDAVTLRTLGIARAALDAGAARAGERDALALLAAAEGAARCAGAEEILLALAPDLLADSRLRRVEGAAALGPVFALQATVAYKGCWLRLARTVGTPSAPLDGAQAWFERLLASIPDAAQAGAAIDRALPDLGGASLECWRIEGVRHGLPLATIAGTGMQSGQAAEAAPPLTLTLKLRWREHPWLGAGPLASLPAASAIATGSTHA